MGSFDLIRHSLLWSLLQDYVSTLSGLLPSNQSAALSPAADDTIRRLAHEAVSTFSSPFLSTKVHCHAHAWLTYHTCQVPCTLGSTRHVVSSGIMCVFPQQ